ncbi:hypothetical protein SEES2008_001325 [Salmonella enterica subsp. enterica serovar Saintpaul str. JO2008]
MSRKREIPDGGAKNALTDLRFRALCRPDKAKPPSGVAVIGAVGCRLLADMG